MHEFSVAADLISLLTEVVQEHELRKVTKVKLVIGTQRMIHAASFQFAFDFIKKESAFLDEAILDMEKRGGDDFYIEYIEGES
ncbi:hydrogenase/urease maturation nickel metallochaperone HypA [Aneurinibacillus sp. REN35]|uniref:hydrogenase/urease maturation nickel metallochaperone HypA n=1 Tax=Aneurinibacillus sp. REN35 TaxID=3237286 RepID=UPI00352970A6